MWPLIRCKEAAAYILAREDRPLDLSESLGLKLHLMICKACPDFQHQIGSMRQLMRAWQDNDTVEPDPRPPGNYD